MRDIEPLTLTCVSIGSLRPAIVPIDRFISGSAAAISQLSVRVLPELIRQDDHAATEPGIGADVKSIPVLNHLP